MGDYWLHGSSSRGGLWPPFFCRRPQLAGTSRLLCHFWHGLFYGRGWTEAPFSLSAHRVPVVLFPLIHKVERWNVLRQLQIQLSACNASRQVLDYFTRGTHLLTGYKIGYFVASFRVYIYSSYILYPGYGIIILYTSQLATSHPRHPYIPDWFFYHFFPHVATVDLEIHDSFPKSTPSPTAAAHGSRPHAPPFRHLRRLRPSTATANAHSPHAPEFLIRQAHSPPAFYLIPSPPAPNRRPLASSLRRRCLGRLHA
jgi:hypothetical protein